MTSLVRSQINLWLALLTALLLAPFVQAGSEPFGFEAYGSFKRMNHTGDTNGHVRLADLSGMPGNWGVGALAGMRGEVLLYDGRLFVSRGEDYFGRTDAARDDDEATLFASSHVQDWQDVPVPQDMTQAEFERFVRAQAEVLGLDVDEPFPFHVEGRYPVLTWHVVTGMGTSHGHGHANKRAGMRLFGQDGATGHLVGFHSGERFEGVISHLGERFHVHYADTHFGVSGHVDAYAVAAGSVLRLPVAVQASANDAPFVLQRVAPDVYAFVGELGLRTHENEGMNATAGFVVTSEGVVVVDSGSSWRVAQQMHEAIRRVTDLPVRYVINTGGQDHRWLGNGYFKAQGATIIAHTATIADIQARGAMQVEGLRQELKERFEGTEIVLPDVSFGQRYALELGGREIQVLHFGGGHTPGDSVVWLPQERLLFAGDLVFVDRLLGVLPFSHVGDWLASFASIEVLAPAVIVPGHGAPCDLDKARRETADYLRLLRDHMRQAISDMLDLQEAIDNLDQSAYAHLPNYDMLKGGNASRVYLEMEAGGM